MSDNTERPEDALRRIAGKCVALEAWQEKYREAAALWDELELEENDQVTDAVLLAKISKFDEGGTSISVSATNGVDWITQLGMLHAALRVMNYLALPTKGQD